MRTDKNKAFELRRQGKSYNEIIVELGMSKSTLSNWFKGVDFSDEIKAYLTDKVFKESTERLKDLNKVRGAALEAWYEEAEREALVEVEQYKSNSLFTTAIALYWGEGDKLSKHHIRFINTDPAMLHLFLVFLAYICAVPKEKISLALYLYKDLDEKKCKRYWSRHVGLKKFHKTQILPSRHQTKRLEYGTCAIVLTNTYLKKKMNVWIDHLPEMVLNTVPGKQKRP